MRKKSHVSLALYLLDSIDSELLDQHKKAFVMGSILPDCKPSFVTTRHNIEETFDLVMEYIDKLTENVDEFKRISTAYCRKLGEVTHYVADYFTYPHNDIFEGNIKSHCVYEKELKYALNEYIQGDDIVVNRNVVNTFNSASDLCDYVKKMHRQYIASEEKNIYSDCRYIVSLCYVVVAGIFYLLNKRLGGDFQVAMA